jgi:methylmalonyl-CoA/ethylmalonyl-CoA epimerase
MRIDHIGIVVHDIQRALDVYETALGLRLKEIAAIPDQQVRVAFLPLGESNIAFVHPKGAHGVLLELIEHAD